MNPIQPSNHTEAYAAATDALDQLLQAHLAALAERLTPSSGFAMSVMDAIHTQATEPAPIAFPWRRVMPGAISVIGILAAFLLLTITGRMAGNSSVTVPHTGSIHPSFSPVEAALGWALMAVCLSLAVAAASLRLATGRSR